MGIFKIGMSEGIERGTNVKKRVDGQGKCRGAEMVGEFFNVMGVRKVVTEWIGVGSVAKEIGGKLSGAGEGEPHPASGRVDKG